MYENPFIHERGQNILTLLAVQVAVAVVYCFFSSGIVFGYAALKPVLIKEGAYSDYCISKAPAIRLHTCYEQEIRYCLLYSGWIAQVRLLTDQIV